MGRETGGLGWQIAGGQAGPWRTGAAVVFFGMLNGMGKDRGAAMKVGYDVMLYAAFRNIRPPEEQKAGYE